MTDIQVYNFVYWLQEYTDFRGLAKPTTNVKDKMELIAKLKKEFLTKYPNGILTNWTNYKG